MKSRKDLTTNSGSVLLELASLHWVECMTAAESKEKTDEILLNDNEEIEYEVWGPISRVKLRNSADVLGFGCFPFLKKYFEYQNPGVHTDIDSRSTVELGSRISLLSVTVDEELKLRFNIVVPKERRNGRRIIKPVLIHSHNAHNLCPVVSFLALKDHPKATVSRPPGTLFVNALDCTLRVTNQTVASWLRRVIRRPTSKQRVSVRSFASSIALQRGLPVDDIQTLGNWATSTTFHNHYRREHLSIVDFTNSVFCWIAGDLPLAHKQENGISSDDEVFFGAEDTIQND
ncbi:hypothetical protein RMATCC62417_08065 [Rhizopus microsporus]|nr:hypothetical protein RMATCC62417_08065 [Rhizopus microsporus]